MAIKRLNALRTIQHLQKKGKRLFDIATCIQYSIIFLPSEVPNWFKDINLLQIVFFLSNMHRIYVKLSFENFEKEEPQKGITASKLL